MSINRSAIALPASYDRRLVILSILIAILVAYTALNLADQLPVPIVYGISTVFISVIAAVLASGLQFGWLNSCTSSRS